MAGRRRWVVLAMCLLAACGGGGAVQPTDEPAAPVVPDGPPYIIGTVTSVSPFEAVPEDCVPPDPAADAGGAVSNLDPPVCATESEFLGSILVEEQPGMDQPGNKASVGVLRDAGIWVFDGDDGRDAEFADITVGARVSVWITGVVRESFPVQVDATAVVIEPEPAS